MSSGIEEGQGLSSGNSSGDEDEDLEQYDPLHISVTLLEDSVAEYLEKVLLDVLINDSECHAEILAQADELHKKIQLEIDGFPTAYKELVRQIPASLDYLKSARVGHQDEGFDILQKYSTDTTLETHSQLDLESRLRKLLTFVEAMCESSKNVQSTSTSQRK